MPHAIDMTGQVFGRWTVIERAGRHRYATMWKVQCTCGTVALRDGHNLRRGGSRSCGCEQTDGARPIPHTRVTSCTLCNKSGHNRMRCPLNPNAKHTCICGGCKACVRRARKNGQRRGSTLARSTEERKAWQREYYVKTVEARADYCASYAKANRRKWRDSWLRTQYGITLIEYERLRDAQDNRCAICGDHETTLDRRTGEPRALSVDHDHATGKVRALLCHQCNIAIGSMNESASRMRAGAAYLERHGAIPRAPAPTSAEPHVPRLLGLVVSDPVRLEMPDGAAGGEGVLDDPASDGGRAAE